MENIKQHLLEILSTFVIVVLILGSVALLIFLNDNHEQSDETPTYKEKMEKKYNEKIDSIHGGILLDQLDSDNK